MVSTRVGGAVASEVGTRVRNNVAGAAGVTVNVDVGEALGGGSVGDGAHAIHRLRRKHKTARQKPVFSKTGFLAPLRQALSMIPFVGAGGRSHNSIT